MNAYVPKVGDKVRATLGESVIVGRHIETLHMNGVHLAPEDSDFPVVLRISDGWQFEQMMSVPTKFGAVIRRADGVIFLLAEPNSADDTDWFGAGCGWHRRSKATAGGFTVLFEGVDE